MIRLTSPDVAGSIDDIKTVLESGFLVQGKNVERFESLVAGYVGRKYAVAVSSGTSAIHCALLAAGVSEGDEVIVPDFTFPATANAVVNAGAVPVLADIDPATFNLDPGTVEARLSARTRAVMPVDLFGLAADLDAIGALCKDRGIMLLEDSACALGSEFGGRKCGSFGAASAFSFHPRKLVTTGEGGMVLTDDDEIARKCRLLRNHGMERSARGVDFVLAGSNMRMNELEACIGIGQMESLDGRIEKRREVASLYKEILSGLDGVRCPVEPESHRHSYQAYVIMLEPRIDRDALIDGMLSEGVETGIGTYAVHAQAFYGKRLGLEPGSLPNSYRAYNQSLALPIYASMEEKAVHTVAAALSKCVSTIKGT
ncbi:DegT/DnrJ/EryC1/StrS family aminotransferase [Candidatus Eisenbacteria bacterium]|uniref:DegT/DnrJ/EryC1/StrS family aminotransferase n=1 Tax=Eiseniibacteriota bacterium TaxID=2212470 RepID=A0ABV6YNJ3_UNCEI